MRVIWLRGGNAINFYRPYSWFVTGVRGSGKSSFLEALAEQYLSRNNTVLDLFGSRDGEGLAWLRSPWAKEKKILLMHGPNVSVDCSHDTMPVGDLQLSDFSKYDILISSSPLYSSPSSEFSEVNRVTDVVYRRMSWNKLVFCVIREAANLYYSRLKIEKSQTLAKSGMIYLVREARHCGLSMGLDTLRMMSIDIDLRNVVDLIIFKAQGIHGLPKDFYFVYRMIKPAMMARMPPDKFFVLSKTGPFGVGTFPEVLWHKKEREHILKVVDIKVEYGDEPDYGIDRGGYRTMSDMEHASISKSYVSGLSQRMIAKEKDRSSSTIHYVIKEHNEQVSKQGYCSRCKRMGGEFFELYIKKGQAQPRT